MTDLPNPGQIYATSYPNTGSVNVQPVGTGTDLSHMVTHPAQLGPVPMYRTAVPQATLGPIPVSMCQPGQSGPGMPNTMVTMVPNPGIVNTGQMRFAGQMIPQTIQSTNPTSLGFKRLLTEMSKFVQRIDSNE
ncbi:unnamed protein product [Echinostoma caproni]|uniref:Deleted in azoospermia-associated protein 2 n=1 Tax=Echinostoma caproni TaxID=27848 RepID=A0A183A867_9TREM|nr:unnamed protein product [Echinostoma caproni]